jgi:hypothetical protein
MEARFVPDSMAALLGVAGLLAMLSVVEVHRVDRPFWGTLSNAPSGLSLGMRLDDFMATSATGTARVVGVDPLTVHLEAVASGAGRQLPIDGLLTVRHVTWTESCFQ